MQSRGSRLQLLALLCLNYFVFCLITNIPSVMLPFWKDDFHLSSTVISFLGSAFFLAYGLTSLPQGLLHDNIGSKKMFLIGVGLILAGAAIFAFFPKYQVGLISLFIIGIGVTALQIVGNLLLKKVDTDPAKYTRNMTFAQTFAGAGGAGGGFLIGYLIKNLGFKWQSVYFVFTGLALLLGLFVLITKIPETAKDLGYKRPTAQDYFKLMKNPLMLFFAFGIFIYGGVEIGVANWISMFLVNNHSYSKINAAQVVSLYWIFQAIGRFVSSVILNYLPTSKALIEYSLACFAVLVIAVLTQSPGLSAMAFIAFGFFTSIMFPAIFSLAVNSFDKREEGVVAGILCTAIVGAAILPPIVGIIAAQIHSLAYSLIITEAICLSYIMLIGWKTLKAPAIDINVDEEAVAS